MAIQQRTWPYGTTRRAVVTNERWPLSKQIGGDSDGQVLHDDKNELHILVGEESADFTSKNGDHGTLTFTEGGPTGGYWKFVKDPL